MIVAEYRNKHLYLVFVGGHIVERENSEELEWAEEIPPEAKVYLI